LNVHEAGGVRKNEIHTADLILPETRASGVEVAIGKVISYKSPGDNQIPAEIFRQKGVFVFRDS
jgi:hypothetical protein